MSVTPLKLVIASCTEDILTIYLVEQPSKYRAVLRFERLKRKVKIGVKFVGDDKPVVISCSYRDDEVDSSCLYRVGDLVDKVFPGVRDALVDELRKVVKEWDNIRLAEELKAEERRLVEGLEPIVEDEVEGRIVRVLASDGAYLSSYGSYIDLGDYVVIAESTYAYTEVVSDVGTLERIDPVGIAVIYKREDGKLVLVNKVMYYPTIQTKIQVGDRLVRLRGESRDVRPDFIYSFPDISTFIKVLNSEDLGRSWVDVGNDIVSNLKEYVVFDDERFYDVAASYVVMTYFYDVFTAVPFLWLHGPPGSGKTRANITITYMCRRGLFVADPSDATLYRIIESLGPTLGIDESVLSEKGKRILAAGYKKGAVVPRAEPTKGGILLKFFEATAPRIFSFEHPPIEDYMLQRVILGNMLKAKPKKFMDPIPNEFKNVREALYYLRLTALPQIVEAKEKALKLLEDNDVWGREAEIWAPILTAAILMGREKSVLEYILEDVGRRRANELIYDEEKVVLAAIDELFSNVTTLTGEDKVIEFMPKDLQKIILKNTLMEEECYDVVREEVSDGKFIEKEVLKDEQRCKELERELEKRWKPQKIGLVLRNLGFDKFKNPKGKGRDTRRYYSLRYSDFVNIAKRYDYEPKVGKGEGDGNDSK